MISADTIAGIEEALSERILSQRAIARRFRVSRGIVNQVALGRIRAAERAARDEPGRYDNRPYQRCAGCGGKVQMPCILCSLRDQPSRSKSTAEPIEVNRRRYQEPASLRAEIDAFYESQRRQRLNAAAERQRSEQARSSDSGAHEPVLTMKGT